MKLRIDKRKLKYVGIVLLALIGSFMFHVDRSDNMGFNRYQTNNGFIKVIRHFLVGLHGKL